MSYILEALRRAESERERKRRVPGLHTQVPGAATDGSSERRSRPWLWVVIGISAGVLVPLLWRAVAGGDPLPEEPPLARAPVAGNVTALPTGGETPASPSAATPAAPVAAPVAAPASVPAVSAAAASAPAPHAAASKAAPAAKPATQARSPAATLARTARAAASGAAGAGPLAQPAPPRAAAAAEPRLRTLAELPEDLRRSVPALAFGGSVYSEVPAQRMVILNGQVLREGDAINEELQIEQIRARSAVLRLRGQRFEIVF